MASTMRARSDAPTVTVIRWPSEAELRWEHQQFDQPRLLVVERGEPVPRMLDQLEDWVLEGTDPGEVNVRAETLVGRWRDRGGPARPVIEAGDVLRYGGRWVALSPTEVKVVRVLLGHFDHCVAREELEGLIACRPGSSALASLVKRLRCRVAPLGLAISNVHARGYVLSGGSSA